MASVVTVNDIINLLDEMAPPELAESWDNVGLMLGRRNKPVRRLLLALDMTQETVTQALAKKADMLITHHPAIFHKLGNVTDADWQQELYCSWQKTALLFTARTLIWIVWRMV